MTATIIPLEQRYNGPIPRHESRTDADRRRDLIGAIKLHETNEHAVDGAGVTGFGKWR